MTRDALLTTLRAAEASLRSRGVAHAALFGSRARGEAGPTSDVDVMIEIVPDSGMDIFRYVDIVHAIQDLFPLPVDVSNRSQLKAYIRPSAERDAVYAF